MSDSREAYVKWRQDRGIRIGDDPIPATEFWDAAWQAAQAQAQAVNQQLLEALEAVLECGSTTDQWWVDQARAAIAAAQEQGK
jgi:type II secretory pathway predicted ATPase ExeA